MGCEFINMEIKVNLMVVIIKIKFKNVFLYSIFFRVLFFLFIFKGCLGI